MLEIDEIRDSLKAIALKYPIRKISIFGSYANGNFKNDSDIDFLIEFLTANISLFMLSDIKCEIEDILQRKVDLIHGPLEEDSLISIDEVIDIYEQ